MDEMICRSCMLVRSEPHMIRIVFPAPDSARKEPDVSNGPNRY